ncbi:hypothetical protein LCGC14_2102720 [marine sediment metagenome]|uniref:Uncharacterized protein n=1 Tax=marine sediment metagenome TaxID=412755 RepID=A0A0F9H5U9_9ZZZZ
MQDVNLEEVLAGDANSYVLPYRDEQIILVHGYSDHWSWYWAGTKRTNRPYTNKFTAARAAMRVVDRRVK